MLFLQVSQKNPSLIIISLAALALMIFAALIWRLATKSQKPRKGPKAAQRDANQPESPAQPVKAAAPAPQTEELPCPQCKTSNRPGAKFCAVCGKALNNAPSQSKRKPFKNRPLQSVFGGQFISGTEIFNSEQQHGYTIKQLTPEASLKIRQCPNPACGAMVVSSGVEIESQCPECQTPLTPNLPPLEIYEAPEPIWANLRPVAEKQLCHAFVRAPILIFEEPYAGENRFCQVLPHTDPLPAQIERQQVLKGWALGLADALAYLHKNGLSFNGQLGAHHFQQSNGRAVFANLANLQLLADPQAQQADVRALAGQLYLWLTGQNSHNPNDGLPPAISQFFREALTLPGFSDSAALIQALEAALSPKNAATRLDFRLGRRTDVGMVRELNEDSLLTIHLNKYLASAPSPMGVYVVADGMGGHAAGEVASGIIVNTLAQKASAQIGATPLSPEAYRQWIAQAIQEANKAVFERGRKMGADMGSTVVVALMEGSNLHLGHVGDSRAYRINARGITPLTTDHSLVERLVATGQITAEEAKIHPQRNVIYRTIGDKPNVEVDTATHPLEAGDRILLCSDGLSGMVSDEIMRQVVMQSDITPQQACDQLIKAANHAGGDDNITVVLVEVEAA